MKTTITNQTKSGAADRDSIIGTAVSSAMADAPPLGPCPAAERLAVLADGNAEGGERDSLFGHMAVCGRCRDIYLLAHELNTEEPVQRGSRGWYMTGGALAVAALVALAVKLTLSPEPEKVRTALTEPAPAARIARIPDTPPAAETYAAKPVAEVAQKSAATILTPVTPEEAALPGSRSYGFAGNTRTDGPEISIEAPAEVNDAGPIPVIRISFAPRDGSVPDLASLRLEYLKQNPVDLTPRVKPFASGNAVELKQVHLPEGLHNFRIVIGDMQGRISEKDFTIMVSGRF